MTGETARRGKHPATAAGAAGSGATPNAKPRGTSTAITSHAASWLPADGIRDGTAGDRGRFPPHPRPVLY